MERLDDNVIRNVLLYLPQQYRYVSLVGRRFRKLYPHAAVTTFHHAMASAATSAIWLQEDSSRATRQGCSFAVKYGKFPALEFLASHGCVLDSNSCKNAAEQGDLPILQWLRSQDPPCDWNRLAMQAAVHMGHLHVVEWIWEQQDPEVTYRFVDLNVGDGGHDRLAAAEGHLHILQWRQRQYPKIPFSYIVITDAACRGQVEVLRWLAARVPSDFWTVYVTNGAAFHGRTAALKYLRSLDPPCAWGESTCTYAVMNGHLSTLKWMRSQHPPCPWNRNQLLHEAALYRHEHVLEWIQQEARDGR